MRPRALQRRRGGGGRVRPDRLPGPERGPRRGLPEGALLDQRSFLGPGLRPLGDPGAGRLCGQGGLRPCSRAGDDARPQPPARPAGARRARAIGPVRGRGPAAGPSHRARGPAARELRGDRAAPPDSVLVRPLRLCGAHHLPGPRDLVRRAGDDRPQRDQRRDGRPGGGRDRSGRAPGGRRGARGPDHAPGGRGAGGRGRGRPADAEGPDPPGAARGDLLRGEGLPARPPRDPGGTLPRLRPGLADPGAVDRRDQRVLGRDPLLPDGRRAWRSSDGPGDRDRRRARRPVRGHAPGRGRP